MKYVLLTLVTCGFYSWYFIYKLAADVNAICEGDGEHTNGLLKLILLSLCTCGIYTYIWYYKLGNRLWKNAQRYGLVFAENGTSVLLWQLFGAVVCGIGPFVAMNIIIKNTNALATQYLSRQSGGQQGYNSQYNNQPPHEAAGQPIEPQPIQPTPQPIELQPVQATPQPIQPIQPIQPAQQPQVPVVSGTQSLGKICGTAGSLSGAEVEVKDGDTIIIGRDPQMSHLIIEDNRVSRKHCGVQYDSGLEKYIIECYSQNGVQLSNNQIIGASQRVMVEPGTSLIFSEGREVLSLM
jgi:hypothetical protein